MGKIADRLARRAHPAFQTVLKIVRLAQAASCFDDAAEAELSDLLDARLRESTPLEFASLLNQAFDELNTHQESEDAAQALQELVENLAELQFLDEDSPNRATRVVAFPFATNGLKSAWNLKFGADVLESFRDALVGLGYVEPQSDIKVLPQALSITAAQSLLEGTVYRAGAALARGEVEAAQAVMQENIQGLGCGVEDDPAASEPFSSFGVLMAVVTSDEEEPLVLPRLYTAEMMRVTSQAEAQEAVSDLNACLAKLSQALSGKDSQVVELTCCFDSWYEAVRDAGELERRTRALSELMGLVRVSPQRLPDVVRVSPTASLKVDEDEDMSFVFTVQHRETRGELGTVEWPVLPHESADEALEAATALFEAEGIQPDGDESVDVVPERPQAVNKRALH